MVSGLMVMVTVRAVHCLTKIEKQVCACMCMCVRTRANTDTPVFSVELLIRHLAITDAASEACLGVWRWLTVLACCCAVAPVTVRFDRAAVGLRDISASPSLPSKVPDGVILCKWHLVCWK